MSTPFFLLLPGSLGDTIPLSSIVFLQGSGIMGVTEKMIGGRLFINFCGKNLVDAADLRRVDITLGEISKPKAKVWVVPKDRQEHEAYQSGLWPLEFTGPEAQAILDWMNAPSETRLVPSGQVRVCDLEPVYINSDGDVVPVVPKGEADAQPLRVGAPVFFDPIKP